jgi:hypothetical protein
MLQMLALLLILGLDRSIQIAWNLKAKEDVSDDRKCTAN